MTVLGSDVNKSFEDGFCDNGDKNSIDKSKESFSSTYFKSIASNKYFDAIADLKLSQPTACKPIRTTVRSPIARCAGPLLLPIRWLPTVSMR